MSFFQRLFTALLPREWAESMEAHSRSWMVNCPKCGYERSVWEIGGIRWKAVGNPRWFMRCPHCGNRSWHKVYRKREEDSTNAG
jgi:phage terminase large subunit GpA-like protein